LRRRRRGRFSEHTIMDSKRCIFPPMPLTQAQTEGGDTRRFRRDEPICVRVGPTDDDIIFTRYIRPDVNLNPRQPGVFAHRTKLVQDGRIVDRLGDATERIDTWYKVGKFAHLVSPTAVRKVAAAKGLPDELEDYITGKRSKFPKGFGTSGGRKTRKSRLNRTRRR